tara:strand:+ start:8278 stop:8526 length:249 start_codon:yes stop_codon:yes gene_type:complete
MKIIKNIIWRWKVRRKFDNIYTFYIENIDIFHPKEQESIESIKKSFEFYFYRSSWERNKEKIEKYIEQINTKINHRIKNTKC